jgi:hypothetical protein
MIVYKCLKTFFCSQLKRYIAIDAIVYRYENSTKININGSPYTDSTTQVTSNSWEFEDETEVTWFYELEPAPKGTSLSGFFEFVTYLPEDEAGGGIGAGTGPAGDMIYIGDILVSGDFPDLIDRRIGDVYLVEAPVTDPETGNDYTNNQTIMWDGTEYVIIGLSDIEATSSNERIIEQTAHGFSLGDIVRIDSVTDSYVLAQSDTDVNSEAAGMVTFITDVDHFTLTTDGYFDLTGSGASALPLDIGCVYFLSTTVAGGVQLTSPSFVGQITKPIFLSETANTGYIRIMRGVEILPAPTIVDDESDSGYLDIGDARIQWGRTSSTLDTGETIAFNVPFGVVPVVTTTLEHLGSEGGGISSITVNDFIYNRDDAVANPAFIHWHAVGKKPIV